MRLKLVALLTLSLFIFQQILCASSVETGPDALEPVTPQKALDEQNRFEVSAVPPVPLTSDEFLGGFDALSPADPEQDLTSDEEEAYEQASAVLQSLGEAVVDTVPPAGTLAINGGAVYTRSREVTLTLSAEDPCSPLDVTGDNLISPLDVLTVTNYLNVYGSQPVNNANRQFDASKDNFVSPLDVLVIINYLNANGPGPASTGVGAMSFSTDNQTWTVVEPFISTKVLTLPPGDGETFVYVKYYDNAGNESTVYSAAIILDTVAPAVVLDEATPSWVAEPEVTLRYAVDGVEKTKTFTDLVEGVNDLTITESDLAENQSVVHWSVTFKSGWTPADGYTLEAEAMTAAGEAWSSGTYVNLWGNGAVSTDPFAVGPGIYDIDVFAISNDAGTGYLPELQLTLDGNRVQHPLVVTNNGWQFQSYKLTGVELSGGAHRLDAGIYRIGPWQYIAVDKIVLRKTGEIPSLPVPRLEIQAEAMMASAGTWNGGAYVTMWGTGGVSAVSQISESGMYEVEIFTTGNHNGYPLLPELQFSLDGDMVQGSMEVSSNREWQFHSYKLSGVELTAGQHLFGVGAYRTAPGQTLAVDRIVMRKTGDIRFLSARVGVEAEAMTASGGTWNGGTYAMLWDGGKVSVSADILEAGIYEAELLTNGNDNGNPVLPQLQFLSDGRIVQGPVEVSNANWHFHSTKLIGLELVAGRHQFEIGAYRTAAGQSIAVDRFILRKISELPSISIQNGQEFANSLQVELDLSAGNAPSERTQMRYGWESAEGVVFSPWESFSAHKTVTMPAGDGEKGIRCQFRNLAGEVKTYRDTIVLDTRPPEGAVRLNSGKDYVSTRTFTVEMKASDELSQMGDYRLSIDGGATWGDWGSLEDRSRTLYTMNGAGLFSYDKETWHAWGNEEELAFRYAVDFSPSQLEDGPSAYSVQYRDRAGNLSVIYTDRETG
ncbi:MAG: dockerin type I domain-containing protein [Candidatus Omnitrophota bacterium]|jgi:hypothetical protein